MTKTDPASSPLRPGELLLMGVFATLMLIPVTLPVPVLRELVQDRFQVSELLTSAFMSVNMVAAFLAAPLSGALSDRFGQRRLPIVLALVADALLFWLMTRPIPFALFMTARFLEGATNVLALSLLLAIAADRAPEGRRSRVMGMLGGGIILGVALGAPLGGVIGRTDPLNTLLVAGGISALTAVGCFIVLREPETASDDRPSLGDIGRMLLAHRKLALPLAFAFCDRFTTGFFTTTFVLFLKRIHDLPSERVGLLIALFLVPFSLLSFLFGRLLERVSRANLILAGSAIYGGLALFVGFAGPGTLPWLMLGLGISASVMFVPSLVLTADLAPAEAKATALGGFNAAGALGFVIGPLTGGLVSEGVAVGLGYGWLSGYRAAFVVAGLSELLLVLCVARALKRAEGTSKARG